MVRSCTDLAKQQAVVGWQSRRYLHRKRLSVYSSPTCHTKATIQPPSLHSPAKTTHKYYILGNPKLDNLETLMCFIGLGFK